MTDVNKPDDADDTKKNVPLISLQPSRLDEVQNAFPRTNRALATVALAVALVAGAVALYMWKEMEQARTTTALTQDDLSDRIGDLESANSARGAELAEARQGNEDVVRQNAELKSALDQLRTRVTRDRGDWLLTEADFLLATANRKLRFEGDVGSAIAAVEEAADRLQRLNDPSLVPVRTLVARDVQALRRIPGVDRTRLAVQISALIQSVAQLPLTQGLSAPATATKPEPERPEVSGWRGFFPALWHDIKGLVTIHRMEQPVMPLLPPEQRFFLHQNLALKLEAARVSLLQREPAIYQEALNEAQVWMTRYFDAEAPAVRTTLEQLARLREANIAPALPDIGESLRQLRRLKRELEVEVRPEALPEAQPKTQPKSQPKAQPRPEAKAQPEARPQPSPEAQPMAQPEAKVEAQPKLQPKAQPNPQPETKPESQPEAGQ
jgi:uroporphyrin-3 C-methyltransferase